ncbi:hypothetical protein JDV02_007145 [Purpureocillium takamizusanense]|uniref:Secreted protein n=1 Tax=Purpureocillium takamizusanense TaxID=2060973 RepID=A0A9Q8QHQ0_9HYPO|nr:uncharacterized protein JDV02_007145 [Purpureocillium takamizusanense]UNI21129.1 hypothetical protein JDV02_007145 [Purpureocillium takamizusanense]
MNLAWWLPCFPGITSWHLPCHAALSHSLFPWRVHHSRVHKVHKVQEQRIVRSRSRSCQQPTAPVSEIQGLANSAKSSSTLRASLQTQPSTSPLSSSPSGSHPFFVSGNLRRPHVPAAKVFFCFRPRGHQPFAPPPRPTVWSGAAHVRRQGQVSAFDDDRTSITTIRTQQVVCPKRRQASAVPSGAICHHGPFGRCDNVERLLDECSPTSVGSQENLDT